MLFEPGLTQRTDLGTKALPKERLKQLIQLWGFRDYSVETTKTLAKLKNGGVKPLLPRLTPQDGLHGLQSWR